MAATEYARKHIHTRARTPDEEAVGPRRAPSAETLREMYAGRHATHLSYFRERMPPEMFSQLATWYNDFWLEGHPGK